MEQVIKEMEEVIRKNLPEATAITLKQYLEEAEGIKAKLKIAQLSVQARDGELTLLRADISALKGRVQQDGELALREKIVTARENQLALDMATLKAAEAEKRADVAYKLAETVFRNPTLVRSVCKSSNSSKSVYSGQDRNETETTREVIE